MLSVYACPRHQPQTCIYTMRCNSSCYGKSFFLGGCRRIGVFLGFLLIRILLLFLLLVLLFFLLPPHTQKTRH